MTMPQLHDHPTADPYALYARWRERSPCFYDDETQRFVVTRYSDVAAILRNHAEFSSVRNIALRDRALASGMPMILLADDPPRHTNVRALLNEFFVGRSIATLRASIETLTDELLGAIEAREVDLVTQLAEPLPVMTIATLLGIDPHDWPLFKRWSSIAAGLMDAPQNEHLREMMSFYGYFNRAVKKRRECPADDLLSRIVTKNAATAKLPDVDLQSLCVLLLIAGNETTTNLISNMIDVLAHRPRLWRSLRDGSIDAAAVVEEALRFESPVQVTTRVTQQALVVGGCSLDAGTVVGACLGAANRDPEEFSDPDTFDPRRDAKRHVAFAQGIHFCLGAALARLEAQIVLNAMARRYRQLEPSSPGIRIQSSIVRGFVSLPLRLSPD